MDSITDFSVSIPDLDTALISYTQDGEEVEKEVEITIDNSEGELPSDYSPGCPPDWDITEVYGLTIEERHHWDLWMAEFAGSLEADIFELIEQDKADQAADYADWQYQQQKDRMIEENI